MGDLLRRFNGFERALLVAAVVAALAAIGVLARGDGPASLLLCVVVAGACVGAAGGSRKRRLLGDRRPLGPIEEIQRDQPVVFVTVTGAFLGLLFAAANGAVVGVGFAVAWIGLQLAVTR